LLASVIFYPEDSMKKLMAMMRAMQKEHGPGSCKFASDTRLGDTKMIPTGIFALDYATGGGIPIGRTSLIYGNKSSGKSSLLAKIACNAQKMCRKCYGSLIFEEQEVSFQTVERDPVGRVVEVTKKRKKMVAVDCVNKCRSAEDEEDESSKGKKAWPGRMNVVWIDAEGTYSPKFYDYFGVDNDGVMLITSEYGEEAVDTADSAIRTGECDVLIVDSIAHFIPKKQREVSTEENDFGTGQAKLINKAMKIWTASLNELDARSKTDCAIILVNQIRQKPGMFPVFVKPGGMGQGFVTSLDIQLWQKEFKFDMSNRPLWMESKFCVEKSKICGPKMEGHYRTCLLSHPGRSPGNTWDDEVVADAAIENGFVTKVGGKIHVLDQKFDTEDDFREELSKVGDFYQVLRAQVVALMIGRPSDGKMPKSKEK
jgi:RecA/RadA recombinase